MYVNYCTTTDLFSVIKCCILHLSPCILNCFLKLEECKYNVLKQTTQIEKLKTLLLFSCCSNVIIQKYRNVFCSMVLFFFYKTGLPSNTLCVATFCKSLIKTDQQGVLLLSFQPQEQAHTHTHWVGLRIIAQRHYTSVRFNTSLLPAMQSFRASSLLGFVVCKF